MTGSRGFKMVFKYKPESADVSEDENEYDEKIIAS
jgi:hypothetical protein